MIAKAGSSRTAQGFAENYDSFAFRQLGASEAICQNREIGFMPDFFRDFIGLWGKNRDQLGRIDRNSMVRRNLCANVDPINQDVYY